MRAGIDPRAMWDMSLYELESMIRSMEKLNPSKVMTEDEYEASKDRWRSLNLPDVRV